ENLDKKDAYKLFWTGDYAPAPKTSSTLEENPNGMPVSVLVGNSEQTSRARDDIADLAKQVAELTKQVTELAKKV
ncbi:hypothetical protein KBZ21_48335, partial [Streptomyces sp. A73]|nr:hypothetical protein [Streptomyces sp. A73]